MVWSRSGWMWGAKNWFLWKYQSPVPFQKSLYISRELVDSETQRVREMWLRISKDWINQTCKNLISGRDLRDKTVSWGRWMIERRIWNKGMKLTVFQRLRHLYAGRPEEGEKAVAEGVCSSPCCREKGPEETWLCCTLLPAVGLVWSRTFLRATRLYAALCVNRKFHPHKVSKQSRGPWTFSENVITLRYPITVKVNAWQAK